MSTRTIQKNLVTEFIALTGAPEKVAQRFLKAAAWRSDIAADNFFANVNSQSKSKERENLENLFQVYHDPQHEKDTLSVDGVMRYLQDLGVNLETAEIFIPLEIVQAPGLGEITRIGFINGWSAVGSCEQISKQKTYVFGQIQQMSTDISLFKKVYRHAFFASKESSQKAIPLENAIVYWSLLFNSKGRRWASESVDWLSLWIEYLQKNWNRTVNKDMWNQTFEFYQKSIVDEKLSFWSEDGAWPGVIDGFVSYVKSKKAL
ncbi:putative defective in cullin neddylation protein 1 [Erysiphe necator]|uniref:Defective in cullin neddylation protein n=1 Tax=Uncinula necator TaxID=52586 RepID=A0A0B1PE74_UNCNE|nr:putative defective in cullin neddylation protein 1 [Erysiphe necator]